MWAVEREEIKKNSKFEKKRLGRREE